MDTSRNLGPADLYLAMRAETHDMRPRIKRGETVIYDTCADAAPGDDVVIDLANGNVILRELVAIEDDEYRLKSYSPASVSTLPRSNATRLHPIIARCNSAFYDEVTGGRHD